MVQGGFVTVAPSPRGAIVHRKMDGELLRLSAGSFLAASAGISLETRFGGLKALFSGEGAFVFDVEGEGDLLFNAYGAIVERDLDGELIVDTGHVVVAVLHALAREGSIDPSVVTQVIFLLGVDNVFDDPGRPDTVPVPGSSVGWAD